MAQWVQEFFCDAVGLSVGGPAFLNAFSEYIRRLQPPDSCRIGLLMVSIQSRSVRNQDLIDVGTRHSQVAAIFRIKNMPAVAENLGQTILAAPRERTWVAHPAWMVKINASAETVLVLGGGLIGE